MIFTFQYSGTLCNIFLRNFVWFTVKATQRVKREWFPATVAARGRYKRKLWRGWCMWCALRTALGRGTHDSKGANGTSLSMGSQVPCLKGVTVNWLFNFIIHFWPPSFSSFYPPITSVFSSISTRKSYSMSNYARHYT